MSNSQRVGVDHYGSRLHTPAALPCQNLVSLRQASCHVRTEHCSLIVARPWLYKNSALLNGQLVDVSTCVPVLLPDLKSSRPCNCAESKGESVCQGLQCFPGAQQWPHPDTTSCSLPAARTMGKCL